MNFLLKNISFTCLKDKNYYIFDYFLKNFRDFYNIIIIKYILTNIYWCELETKKLFYILAKNRDFDVFILCVFYYIFYDIFHLKYIRV